MIKEIKKKTSIILLFILSFIYIWGNSFYPWFKIYNKNNGLKNLIILTSTVTFQRPNEMKKSNNIPKVNTRFGTMSIFWPRRSVHFSK